MSTGTEFPKENTNEVSTSPEIASAETSGAQSDLTTAEVHEALPVPVEEPPGEFIKLKAHCNEMGMKCEIDLTPPPFVNVEFKNGRTTRTVYVGSEEAAETLLHYPLSEILFLGEYSAICSYRGGWIEAAVRAHGQGPRDSIARSSIFGVNAARAEGPAEIEITGSGGVKLRLSEKRNILYWLDYGSPIYLKIEGIDISEHDKTLRLLEDLSNSLFMQIDFKFDSPLTLGRDRLLPPRVLKSPGRLDEDNQLIYPRFSYERSPSSLYWYARSATSMPLLQFLAFYQCIEFFFPQYSRQEAIAKIKNVLKDPAFDGTKDSYVNMILNTTLEGRRGSFLEERKQLGAALKQCVDETALRDFLSETEERKQYYRHEYKKISDKKITLSDDAVVDQTAERIYDIRCKVVHTKNMDEGEGHDIILPFSREADLLMDDVELIKFLARKVLIASSAPLTI